MGKGIGDVAVAISLALFDSLQSLPWFFALPAKKGTICHVCECLFSPAIIVVLFLKGRWIFQGSDLSSMVSCDC